jgi:hypothetical protein
MFNRAFHHVHDTNEGDDTSFRFYIWQLGYALFPWTGLAPLGLTYWMRRSDSADRGKGDVAVFLFMWFLFAFALFSFMGTKFHHYVFPVVPPVAFLIGMALDDALAHEDVQYTRMIGAAAVAGAVLTLLVTSDLVTRAPGEQDGAIRFAQLFSYQYKRPWPEMLDFHRPLLVVGAGAALLTALLASRARAWIPRALVTLAVVAAAFELDVYMVKTAPLWGQGDVIRAYYKDRAGDEEPLVAFQMNWKGENFYTGNRVPAFVSSGAPFTAWVREKKEHGTKVVYFVAERSRVASLKAEAGARAYREITGVEASHHFTLVRAEL